MTAVWCRINQLADIIKNKISENSSSHLSHTVEGFSWYNEIYSGDSFRRAHVEIVDFRESHKIYILHCTIFPHYNDNSPIWGFDAVCGPNKITGAFHDFSNGGAPDHFMMNWFSDRVSEYKWRKPRQLPPWAQAIFSQAMIAAGNVTEGDELDDLCKIALSSLDYYLDNVGLTQESAADFHMAHDRYCRYQKQNPHVANSMVSMGVPKELMDTFIREILFPESL